MYYRDAITAYKKTLKLPRARRIRKEKFMQIAVSRWVCNEMLCYIRKHPNMTPLEAATQFRLDMEEGNCNNYNNSQMFYAAAEDAAQDIIDEVFYSRRYLGI